MSWPTNFPENCPPSEAIKPNVLVFRFVRNNPPTPDDFKSYREDGKNSSGAMECQSCGVSVYTESNDILEAQKQIPGMKKRMIATGRLEDTHGAIMSTPSKSFPSCGHSHHTWWKILGLVPPFNNFEIIFDKIV